MPIYEYKCLDCGKDYEELVPVSEKKNPPCPSCKGENVEKKMSLFGSAGSVSCGTSGFS
jgi:putative FmdB family regulatory protein